MRRRRKNSEPAPQIPSSFRRNSLAGGFHGVWSSDTKLQRPTLAPEEDDEGSKRKLNVTFPQTGHHHHHPNNGSEAPNVAPNGPKTSEYAFFKKLKKGEVTSLINAYHPLQHSNEADHQPRSSSECSRDRTTYKFITKHKNLKFSSSGLAAEQVTPLNVHSCHPSPFEAPATSFLKHTLESRKSLVPVKKVAVPVNYFDLPSPFEAPATSSSGRQGLPEDVFCLRRKRLHRWVADTSCTISDEMDSRGYGLVNVLVSRLFPESNENGRRPSEHPNVRQGETDCEDDHKIFKKLHRLPWEEPEDISYDDDGSLPWQSNDFRKVVSQNWDCVGYDVSACHYDNIVILDKKWESDLDLDCRRTANCYTESNKAYGYRVEYPSSYNEMELDEQVDVSNEPALNIQSHSMLLDWSVNSTNEELDSYIASENNSESSSCFLSTSPSDSLNRFCFSPFISNNAPNFASPLHLLPARYHNFDSEKHLLDEEEGYSDPKLNHFPLALTHTPNYCDVAEDFCGNAIFSSTQWLPAMAMDAFCLSHGLDYSLEKKWLSVTDSFSSKRLYLSRSDEYEDFLDNSDEFGIYDRSSNNFQISFEDENKPLPLLLANSSWDAFEGDGYSDALIPSSFSSSWYCSRP